MKTLIIIALTNTLTLLISYHFFSTENNTTVKEVVVKHKELPIDIKKVLDDYFLLKEKEKTFNKSDELLGKAMLLFMANIGYQFSPQVKEKLSQIQSYQGELEISDEVNNLREESVRNEITKVGTSKLIFTQNHNIEIESLPIEFDQFKSRLKKTIFKKPNMAQFNTPRIKSLESYIPIKGKYRGVLVLSSGKNSGQKHDVVIDSMYEIEENKLVGKYKLELSYQGSVYSSKGGDGDLKSIRKSDKEFYIFDASPTSFMQLYLVKNQLVGHYYDDGKHLGVVQLIQE